MPSYTNLNYRFESPAQASLICGMKPYAVHQQMRIFLYVSITLCHTISNVAFLSSLQWMRSVPGGWHSLRAVFDVHRCHLFVMGLSPSTCHLCHAAMLSYETISVLFLPSLFLSSSYSLCFFLFYFSHFTHTHLSFSPHFFIFLFLFLSLTGSFFFQPAPTHHGEICCLCLSSMALMSNDLSSHPVKDISVK